MLFAGLQIQSNRHLLSGYHLRDERVMRAFGKKIPLPYREDLTLKALYSILPPSVKRTYRKLRHY